MKHRKMFFILTFCLIFSLPFIALANDSTSATVYFTSGEKEGEKVGTVNFTNDGDTLVINTDFAGLPEGERGFHIHENPDCSNVVADNKTGYAMAAGGHYDPENTGKHLGPEGGGHKGDLPFLTVGEDGVSKETFKVKGIKASEFANRSVMIHVGGDNYSDEPAALGGGGARLACGIVK